MNAVFKKLCTAALILLICACIAAAYFAFLFLTEPGAPIVHLLPYGTVRQYLLYDHITYNDIDYYLTDDTVPHSGQFITEDVRVVLVDKDGDPYKEGQTEAAWLYAENSDAVYIYFDSANYKREN